ncbi:MAG: fibronectin type III domain-containing protein, partial [Acutalibacteraceae bacterium]
MTKKFISLFLCVIMMFSVASVGFVKADAVTYDISRLAKLAKKFPDGKYWNHVGSKTNNPDGYTNSPCTHHGKCKITEGGCECNFFNGAIQCKGYAYKAANELVGTEFSNWKESDVLDASKLCVGDIIRYLNNTHSVTVVGVKGSTIAYTGANWGGNCLIKWATMDVKDVKGFSYVLHDPGNKYKNSNITFFEDPKNYITNDVIPDTTEIWQVTADPSLVIRKSPSTSSDRVSTIPKGSSFYVTEKKFDGTFLWGKVEYNTLKGWSALNYAKYISGAYQNLMVYDIPDNSADTAFNVYWSTITAAEKYTVTVYDSNSECVVKFSTTDNKAEIVLSEPGEYSIVVTATNSASSSWKVKSEKIGFKIVDKPLPVPQEIKFDSETASLYIGQSLDLNISTVPKNAYKGFVFSSSDKSVATVNRNGVIKARKIGSTVITCKSSEDSKVFATCKVKVSLAPVTTLKQTSASTSSVKLTWTKVSGASGYILSRKTSSGNWKKVADVSTNSFTEKNLSAGKDYLYSVKAYASDGSKITYGKSSGAIYASTCPTKVSSVKVSKITSSSYTLSWKKISSATSYIVYRYNDSKKTYEKYKTVTGTSLKISGKAGQTKKYKVAAVRKKQSF